MVEDMSPATLQEKLSAADPVQVIDIRNEPAFAAGHIPGAINVPFHRFVQQVETLDWRDEIVVACPVGQSSVQAARLLESYEGLPADAVVYNLDGGYDAWDGDLETE